VLGANGVGASGPPSDGGPLMVWVCLEDLSANDRSTHGSVKRFAGVSGHQRRLRRSSAKVPIIVKRSDEEGSGMTDSLKLST
jgi:hypothetical protein